MEPTLRDGDHLLVRWGGRPQPDRLVVVSWPDLPLSVKRVSHRDDDGWWAVRDNPREGTDSWSAGPLATDQVLGVVLLRLWPLRRRGTA
jgi:hypothetical protein